MVGVHLLLKVLLQKAVDFELRKSYLLLISDQALLPEPGRNDYGMYLSFLCSSESGSPGESAGNPLG